MGRVRASRNNMHSHTNRQNGKAADEQQWGIVVEQTPKGQGESVAHRRRRVGVVCVISVDNQIIHHGLRRWLARQKLRPDEPSCAPGFTPHSEPADGGHKGAALGQRAASAASARGRALWAKQGACALTLTIGGHGEDEAEQWRACGCPRRGGEGSHTHLGSGRPGCFGSTRAWSRM